MIEDANNGYTILHTKLDITAWHARSVRRWKALRLRVGFHRDQEVRYPKEEADYTIDNIEDFLKIPPIADRLAR